MAENPDKPGPVMKSAWNALGLQAAHVIELRSLVTHYAAIARHTRTGQDIRKWISALISALDECYPLFHKKDTAKWLRDELKVAYAFVLSREFDDMNRRVELINGLGDCTFEFMQGTQEDYLYSFKEKKTKDQVMEEHLSVFGKKKVEKNGV